MRKYIVTEKGKSAVSGYNSYHAPENWITSYIIGLNRPVTKAEVLKEFPGDEHLFNQLIKDKALKTI